MSKIEIGRYSAQLRRMFSMKGQETVASELSPEVSPTIELGGAGPEWYFLRDERLMICNVLEVADPVLRSSFRVRNPVDSGVVAIIEAIDWNCTQDTEQDLLFDVDTTDLTTPHFPIVRDTRWANRDTVPPTVSISPIIFSSQGLSVVGSRIWQARCTPTTINHQILNFVLGPGFSLNGGNGNPNLRMSWTFYYRERHIPPIER